MSRESRAAKHAEQAAMASTPLPTGWAPPAYTPPVQAGPMTAAQQMSQGYANEAPPVTLPTAGYVPRQTGGNPDPGFNTPLQPGRNIDPGFQMPGAYGATAGPGKSTSLPPQYLQLLQALMGSPNQQRATNNSLQPMQQQPMQLPQQNMVNQIPMQNPSRVAMPMGNVAPGSFQQSPMNPMANRAPMSGGLFGGNFGGRFGGF